MDSRTVWTVVSINASRVRKNCLDFEEFLRTREKSLKTTVLYCPTVHRMFRQVCHFHFKVIITTTRIPHYFVSN